MREVMTNGLNGLLVTSFQRNRLRQLSRFDSSETRRSLAHEKILWLTPTAPGGSPCLDWPYVRNSH